MAILYPEKKEFRDMSERIKIEDLDACYIFNSSLKNVQDEAQRLLEAADLEANENSKEELHKCFGCGIRAEKLSRCAACKLASYCSKVFHTGLTLK